MANYASSQPHKQYLLRELGKRVRLIEGGCFGVFRNNDSNKFIHYNNTNTRNDEILVNNRFAPI